MIKRLLYSVEGTLQAFKIIDDYNFKNSNNEVNYSDIIIDFTGYTATQLPYKYQEITVVQAETEDDILTNHEVLFVGFLDEFELSDMKLADEKEERELTLSLFSPLEMATKRSVFLSGTYSLKEAIQKILEPLVNDGFEISVLDIINGQITVQYYLETIENCMNNLGYKRNIFWFINNKKEIYVYSLDILFSQDVTKTIDESVKEKGLFDFQPTIENSDYFNVLNFKNIRLKYYQDDTSGNELGYPILNLNKNIENGDIITFNHPIVVDEDTLQEFISEFRSNDMDAIDAFGAEVSLTTEAIALYIKIESSSAVHEYKIYMSLNDIANYITEGSITYSDDSGDEGEIVLQRDSFFSNLITGFKWNVDESATITEIKSHTALRYTRMRFENIAEVEKQKGIISNTGIIEKTIDLNSSWYTFTQLVAYANSLMVQNENEVNTISLSYDIDPGLEIGNIVEINCPSFYSEGKFAVQKINYKYINDNDEKWDITLKKSNLLSSFIDIFRPSETEISIENIESVIISPYAQEEIQETHALTTETGTTTSTRIDEDRAVELAIAEYGGDDTDGLGGYISGYDSTGDIYYVTVYNSSTTQTLAIFTVNSITGEIIYVGN